MDNEWESSELFSEETGPDQETDHDADRWKVMIVDDDEDVHRVTELVLSDFSFMGRRIQFLNAYSRREAQERLRDHQDVNLILLDVVMEEEDAGLQLVRFIRHELNNHLVRIVLRTGQPGQAPEDQVIVDYDINDYKAKTELTAEKLFVTVVASLRTYKSLLELETAKQKVIRSEQRWRSLWENVPDQITEIDGNHRIELANHADSDQLFAPGNSIFDAVPPERHEDLRNALDRAHQTGEMVQYETVQPEGEQTSYYANRVIPLPFHDSEPGYLCIATNITQLKNAENELRRVKNYLDNVINSMPSILVGIDPKERVTHWNPAAANLTNIPTTEARGRDLVEVFPLLKPHMETLRALMKSGPTEKTIRITRVENVGKSHFEVMAYPLRSDRHEGAVLRIDNITARVRLDEMMVQTEKMMSVGGLAAGMAHEINNPLSGILQSAQNILRRFSPELAKNREVAAEYDVDLDRVLGYMGKRGLLTFIENIRESGERATKIVDNMLKFSRPSPSRKEPCHIPDIIERSLQLVSNNYDLKKGYDIRHIRVVRRFQPECPKAPCVAMEIEQVIFNLLKNAVQAMPCSLETKAPAQIILQVHEREGNMEIIVEDNGPGMAEQVRKRIFEPFFTTKGVGAGTGLGLSVSYFIITNNHNGTMSVESAPGKGTRFTITLPM